MSNHDTQIEIYTVNKGHEWLKQKQFAGSPKILIALFHFSLRFVLFAVSL